MHKGVLIVLCFNLVTFLAQAGDISVTINSPNNGQTISKNQVSVNASVTSVYEISSVVVFSEQQSTNMTRYGTNWVATLSLEDIPHGTHSLTVRVTDTLGTTSEAILQYQKNLPPQIAITWPRLNQLVGPRVRFKASATDDGPTPPEIRVQIKTAANETIQLRSLETIDQEVDLSSYAGNYFNVTYYFYDELGFTYCPSYDIFMEKHPGFEPIPSPPLDGKSFPVVLDRTDTHFLFQTPIYAGYRLTGYDYVLMDRATGEAEYSNFGPIRWIMHLTPKGHLYAENGSLFEVSSGSTNKISDGIQSLQKKGSFVFWLVDQSPNGVRENFLLRRNLATSDQDVIYDPPGLVDGFTAAANGDLVFSTFPPREFWRVRSGAFEQISTNYCVGYRFDGTNTVFLTIDSQNQLYYHDGTTTELITGSTASYPYALTNGWLAYAKMGNNNQPHVFIRNPAGTHSQLTFFNSASLVDALNGNGELMIKNATLGKRYYYKPGQALVALGESFGIGYWFEGQFHLGSSYSFLRFMDARLSKVTLGNGQVSGILAGKPYLVHDLHHSSDLSNWSSMVTLTNTSGVISFTNSVPTTEPNFYLKSSPRSP